MSYPLPLGYRFFTKALLWGAFVVLSACSQAPPAAISPPPEPAPKTLSGSLIHLEMGQSLEAQGDYYEAQKQYQYALRYLERQPIDSVLADSILEAHLFAVLDGLESSWAQAEGDVQEDTLGYWFSDFEEIHLDTVEQMKIKGLSDSISFDQFSIPIVLNDRVYEELHYLSQRVPKFMKRSLTRKTIYEDLIYKELDSMNVPRDLIYQALVESGYKTTATSHASAGGIWQFIPSTGRAYGMKIDWWVDERRDPLKSTRGAIAFMKDLHKRFGDWYLAMAAYNAGGGRINRAIKKAGSKNYWDLKLPKETMHYVPRIIAATIIGHNPERYGIEVTHLEPREFQSTQVSHCIPFSTVAKLIGVPVDTLRVLNPELRRDCTPSDALNYNFNLPPDKIQEWEEAYAKLDKSKLKRLHRHRVRSGEFLGKIANQYGISVKAIMSANNMRSTRLRVGQNLVIPLPSELGAQYAKNSQPQGFKIYQVRRGDNLYKISKKLGVGIDQLLRDNKLKARSALMVGQKLKYPAPQVAVRSTRQWKSNELKNYRVQSGDSFYSIGKQFGISSNELMAINKASQSSLKVGQNLKVPRSSVSSNSTSSKTSTSHKRSKSISTPRVSSQVYTVKSGDNLYTIAKKFKVSLGDLVSMNNIKQGQSIYPGMQLKVAKSTSSSSKKRSSKGAHTSVKAGIVWYTVQSGDTLWGISKQHQVSVDQLKSWNQLDRRALQPGMKIKVGESR